MTSLKSNFIKLGFVLTIVVAVLVTLSLGLATRYDAAIAEKTGSSQYSAFGFNGGPIPGPTQ